MSGNKFKDNTNEVTNSTDWLETPLKSLATVEAALRCQICKEFYDTPLITSCEHTFCSLCIRRCLNQDGKCPVCRKDDQSSRLRHCKTLDELVQGFKLARPEVFAFATRPAATSQSLPPKRTRDTPQESYQEEEPPNKRARPSRATRSRTAQNLIVLESDGEDEDFELEEEEKSSDGRVECPICSKRVKEASINLHIDRGCPDEPSTPKSQRFSSVSSPSRRPLRNAENNPEKPLERLAQVNYGMMNENKVRKKALDLGLIGAGNKPIMEKRITEWITLWNANCDATFPKTKAELRREMDMWERTQGVYAPSSSTGNQIKSKDFDAAAWSTQHDASFKDLIANARKKAQAAKSVSTSSDKPDTPVPDSNLEKSSSKPQETFMPSSISDFTSNRVDQYAPPYEALNRAQSTNGMFQQSLPIAGERMSIQQPQPQSTLAPQSNHPPNSQQSTHTPSQLTGRSQNSHSGLTSQGFKDYHQDALSNKLPKEVPFYTVALVDGRYTAVSIEGNVDPNGDLIGGPEYERWREKYQIPPLPHELKEKQRLLQQQPQTSSQLGSSASVLGNGIEPVGIDNPTLSNIQS